MIIDLEKVDLDKKIDAEIPGWEKLIIEYGFRAYSGISWLIWRVSGTEHLFQIQHQVVITRHGVDLLDHFILTLQTFREDYKEWERDGFSEEWMKKYHQQFNKLIL